MSRTNPNKLLQAQEVFSKTVAARSPRKEGSATETTTMMMMREGGENEMHHHHHHLSNNGPELILQRLGMMSRRRTRKGTFPKEQNKCCTDISTTCFVRNLPPNMAFQHF